MLTKAGTREFSYRPFVVLEDSLEHTPQFKSDPDQGRLELEAILSMSTDAIFTKGLNNVNHVQYVEDDTFGLRIPTICPGVAPSILQPRHTWTAPVEYDLAAARLASQFVDNFKKIRRRPRHG
jgi:ATP-dependent phosphoenolpyruvate carboxykinase